MLNLANFDFDEEYCDIKVVQNTSFDEMKSNFASYGNQFDVILIENPNNTFNDCMFYEIRETQKQFKRNENENL